MKEKKCKRHQWQQSDYCNNCGAYEEYCRKCHIGRLMDSKGKEISRDD
jgi:hypothetical protein